MLIAIFVLALMLGIGAVTRENYRLRQELRDAMQARHAIRFSTRVVRLSPGDFATVSVVTSVHRTQPALRLVLDPASSPAGTADPMPSGADAFAR
jgi:hypothetical protein